MGRVSLLVTLVLTAGQAAAQRRVPPGTLEVMAALVGEELQIRPIPLLQLDVTSLADTTVRDSLRTGLDGRASRAFVPGAYRLRSLRAAALGGKSYTWSVRFDIESGKTTHLELTNANADSTTAVASGRQVAPEVGVYERVKRGVLRVNSGLGHGSGFLLDTLGGVLITNDHVVAGGQSLTVMIDSVLRVPARLVVTDQDADLAVLLIDSTTCTSCPRLKLAAPDSSGAVVVPGERVIAVGFPLNQQSSITSGIVSSVREHAIISDVNINPGNSGGPLLNLAGFVVGINAFGDQEGGRGPGISGSISIDRLASVLRRAADTLRYVPYPEAHRLPTLPGARYPLSLIRSISDTARVDDYERLEFGVGDFNVRFGTPIAEFVSVKRQENEISRDRRKREQRAGLSEEQRFSQFRQLHDWIQYVGDYTTPAVIFEATPKIGETTGSIFARVLAGPGIRAKMVFKGDFHEAFFFRNGEPVVPVMGGRTAQTVFEENRWVVMKDVAYRGYYILPPETFAPDSAGVPPSIVIQIDDLKHYDRLILREISGAVVARIWNDFAPYYAAVRPDFKFIPADPLKFRSTFSGQCSASELCSGMRRFERPSQQPRN